jgi:hypothetical protein
MHVCEEAIVEVVERERIGRCRLGTLGSKVLLTNSPTRTQPLIRTSTRTSGS